MCSSDLEFESCKTLAQKNSVPLKRIYEEATRALSLDKVPPKPKARAKR